jgi:RNA polymerase sigma-70 factor, ECF subfamily
MGSLDTFYASSHDLRVVAPPASRPHDPNGTPSRLGDLLYGVAADTPVSETEWVGLVGAIAKGDQEALRILYERMHRLVFTLAVRITHNRETAEEVVLDVFHDVWRRAGTYDVRGGTVVGWIMNQARSRAIDRVRFEQRKKRVPGDRGRSSAAAGEGGAGPVPGDELDLREQAQRLQQALSNLTPHERQAIETAFFAELTYPEVAARLNQPLGTVKTRIRSALSKLREALTGKVLGS